MLSSFNLNSQQSKLKSMAKSMGMTPEQMINKSVQLKVSPWELKPTLDKIHAANQKSRNQALRDARNKAASVKPLKMVKKSANTNLMELYNNAAYRLNYDTAPIGPIMNQFMLGPEHNLLFGSKPTDPAAFLQYINDPTLRFRNDPGYEFNIKRGMDAILNNAGSRGLLRSGAVAKALAEYMHGVADQTYNNWQSKEASAFDTFRQGRSSIFTDQQNRLAALAGAYMPNAGQMTMQGGLAGAQGFQNRGTYNGNLFSGLGTNVMNTFLQGGLGQGQAMTEAAKAAAQLGASENQMAAQNNATMGGIFNSILGLAGSFMKGG